VFGFGVVLVAFAVRIHRLGFGKAGLLAEAVASRSVSVDLGGAAPARPLLWDPWTLLSYVLEVLHRTHAAPVLPVADRHKAVHVFSNLYDDLVSQQLQGAPPVVQFEVVQHPEGALARAQARHVGGGEVAQAPQALAAPPVRV